MKLVVFICEQSLDDKRYWCLLGLFGNIFLKIFLFFELFDFFTLFEVLFDEVLFLVILNPVILLALFLGDFDFVLIWNTLIYQPVILDGYKIFENIKKRENIKAKLQAKNNRNESIMQVDRDKLDEVTQILEEDIKMFKDKHDGMNIVWKGIYYEWFMNYEKWFYEMEIRNDLDYLN